MSGFSDNFPDTELLDVLGDDITIKNPYSPAYSVKGIFNFKFIEEGLGDTIDISYPVIDCLSENANNIHKDSKIEFNSKTYKLLKKYPLDNAITQLVLKLN